MAESYIARNQEKQENRNAEEHTVIDTDSTG